MYKPSIEKITKVVYNSFVLKHNSNRNENEDDIQVVKVIDVHRKKVNEIKEFSQISTSLNSSCLNTRIWECPICLEPSRGQKIVTTKCGHIYCQGCIENYCSEASGTAKCPTCNAKILSQDLCVLYNI